MAPLLDRYAADTLKFGAGNVVVAYYRMREGSGTTLVSATGANNGTYSATGINWVTTTGTSATGYSRSSGRDAPLFNSHLNVVNNSTSPPTTTPSYNAFFDGASGRATASLSGISVSAGNNETVEMWVKWDGVLSGANGTFEALAAFGGATGLLLGFLKNGASDYRFGLSVRNTGDLWGLSNATTLAVLQRDVYHHIVFVIVNNAVQTSKLYIDGVQYTMSQQIGTSTTTKSVDINLTIGYDGTASWFGGSIAEFAFFNGTATPIFDATGVKNRYHTGAFGGAYQEIPTVPGIEGQIEFVGDPTNDDVIMNRKIVTPGRGRTLDQYYLNEIGGLDDPDIRFGEEPNFYRDGMNPLVSRYGGRTMTFDGYIEAMNFQSMRQLQSKLKRSLNSPNALTTGLGESTVILRNVFDNGFDFCFQGRKNAPMQMKEAQSDNLPRRKFLITLRSSYPYLESVGSRTDVLILGATLTIPHKGTAISLPVINMWGPFSSANFILNNTAVLTGTVAASTYITLDCKNRTCSDWTKFSVTGDFPYLLQGAVSDTYQNVAQFITAVGGTAGVTRVEITWKHAML